MPPLSSLGTIVAVVRSTLFAIFFYGLSVPFVTAALIAIPLGWRPVSAIAAGWSRTHRWLAHWILGQKVVVIGAIPSGPQFIICKHESMFETLDAVAMFNRPVVAAKRELLDIPFWGRVARAYGLIVVEREGGASALRTIRAGARAAFAAGRAVVFYPEGTRVPHGASPEIKSGFAGVYAILDCPVIPVAVDSGRLSPRKSFIKRAGTITYLIGEAIPPRLPRAEAEQRVHAAINALNKPSQGGASDSP